MTNEYKLWLERMIEQCYDDKNLQREHWAFCQALKRYRQEEEEQLPQQEKDINYWKNNCEDDYITTPISVLRYISELEKLFAYPQQETMYKENTYKINANTYITNESEIKKGDWFLEKAGRQYPIQWNGKEKLNFHCKKIILTTDQYLINDGVKSLKQ